MTVTVPHRVTLPRLLPGTPQRSLDAHLEAHGPLPAVADLAALLAEAGLTGRGGAGFPVHRKLESVAAAARRTRRTPVVVGNGCEGEPASVKDKALLATAPHLVLDGLQAAAAALGADRAQLAVEDPALVPLLREAVGERQRAGATLPVQVTAVPRRFLTGESSALTSFLAGGEARPRHPQPPVRERGVDGAPTLVQNVETLAQLALILRHGPAWYRAVGTPTEPGTLLCTVHDGSGGPPQVVEAATGTPLRRVLGPLPRTPQAVLVGGYHGSWVPAEHALGTRLEQAALGVPLGAGVLAALPADCCGLVETARVLRYLALESAGQCGPCLNGLPRMAAAFAELAVPGRATPAVRADLERWAGLVTGRGACHHPDGTARFARSALAAFAAEADAHVAGWCTATDTRPVLPTGEVS